MTRLLPFALAAVLTACSTAGTDSTTTTSADTVATQATGGAPTSSTSPVAAGPYTVDTRIPFTDVLVLDVYRPEGDGTWPVAVVVHGGGWVGGERADSADLSALLATEGLLVYNISYRTMGLGGGFPSMFEDVACGVRFARSTAAEYDGDSTSIALVGYSAGAHLGAVVALAGDDFEVGNCRAGGSPLPDAFVGIAGPYDSDRFSPLLIPFFGGTPAEAADAWAAGNPFTYVDRRLDLPLHLLHGSTDGTVPVGMTEDFAAALEAAGHTVAVTIVEGAGHRDMVDPTAMAPLVAEAVLTILP